ncbi:hypothetical protein DRQ50_05860 [bacterium]|nr:MAG: hypothetical protein DRQ50_05860 [bacterium]
MNDEALLNTPGELLAAARKRQGTSLTDLAARTKIPVAMLDAIERDEYHRISDPLYVKSFLRNAAVEVGLDPDEVLDLYSRVTGSSRPGVAPEEIWEEKTVTIHRVGFPWGRVAVLATAAVLVVAVVILAGQWLGGGESDDGLQQTPVVALTDDEPSLPANDQSTAGSEATDREDATRAIDTSRDTLAGGRLAEVAPVDPDQVPTATSPPPAATSPVEADPEPEAGTSPPATVVVDPADDEQFSPADPVPAVAPGDAVTGSAGLALAAGHPRSQILRVLTTAPVTISVRHDGQRSFARYRLPGSGAGLPSLPESDIDPGRAYAVAGGVVAYWGARDHFDLVLDRVDGVEVSLNGRVHDLSGVRPGDELVLDAFEPPRPR